MPRFLKTLCLLALIVPAAPLAVSASGDNAQANEDERSAKAAEALRERLSGYTTFQASFTQFMADGRGDQVQESRGKLKARRPGYFYWRTEPPLEQVIVSDGEKVTVYDPDLMQATVYPMEKQLSATPALLLSGEVKDLAESFDITHEQISEDKERFTLEPVQADSLFLELKLIFVDGVLDEMRLYDAMDQLSVLMFNDVVLNETVEDDIFTLDLDDSVDVIREQVGN